MFSLPILLILLDILTSFTVSFLASLACYYFIKWLDTPVAPDSAAPAAQHRSSQHEEIEHRRTLTEVPGRRELREETVIRRWASAQDQR